MAVLRTEATQPRCGIVALEAACQALTPAARQGDDEVRRHEAGDRAADLGFEAENGRERGAEVFDAADKVVLEDVVLEGWQVRLRARCVLLATK